jgi:formylmethanofuran dehydrogenase subunit E
MKKENHMEIGEIAYTFRLSKTYSNIRVRDCANCGELTKQQQAQDAGGKWVDAFRCISCRSETR